MATAAAAMHSSPSPPSSLQRERGGSMDRSGGPLPGPIFSTRWPRTRAVPSFSWAVPDERRVVNAAMGTGGGRDLGGAMGESANHGQGR